MDFVAQSCSALTQCLLVVCSRNLTEDVLSGAYVDCVHQCDGDAARVLSLANQTCEQVRCGAVECGAL